MAYLILFTQFTLLPGTRYSTATRSREAMSLYYQQYNTVPGTVDLLVRCKTCRQQSANHSSETAQRRKNKNPSSTMSSQGQKRKKTHLTSDFKHRKAKVGKRAPQQLNLTDTAFKAVSVQVQGQSIAGQASGDAVLSSRGKSIPDLTHQLHHPAGAVRVSAIRGLTNVIQGAPFSILETHLSALLPVISKCACVDEEDDVRNLGLVALRDIIKSSDGDDKLWKPFIPLLAAFVTSALNSLDRATRLDGSRAVEIVSYLPLDRKTVATILPAYIALLQDHSLSTSKTPVEGKKKKKTDENKRLVILQSMVSLLRSIDVGNEQVSDLEQLDPDLIILPGGLSTNALLLLTSRDTPQVEAIDSLEKLSIVSGGEQETEQNQKGNIAQSTVVDLFSKLRDVYVEVTQRGGQGDSGVTLCVADMEELSLLVSSIHLLWKCFARNQKSSVVTNLVNMMLESMPVKPRTQDQIARYEALNGNLCFSVIEMGTDLLKESKWTDAILEYLLPKLDAQNQNQSTITMNVLWGLMHLKDQEHMSAISPDTQEVVLQRITGVYFSGEALEADVSRSLGGRKAVKLAISLLKDGRYEIVSESMNQMIKCFPNYLLAWGGDYLTESNDVLETLHRVVRRLDLSEKSAPMSNLLLSLRQGMGPLFVAEKKQGTVFEHYSLQLQRKTMCLVVSLGSPTQELIKGLGKICARAGAGISHELADFILDIMHTSRTTMQIQAYLGFVMASIGVPKSSTPAPGGAWISVRDKAALRASRALRRCGAAKILPMIAPMLSSWLKPAGEQAFVRFRVALLLMTTFAQEDAIFDAAPELRTSLLAAIIDFFQACSSESDTPELLSIFEKALMVCIYILGQCCMLF